MCLKLAGLFAHSQPHPQMVGPRLAESSKGCKIMEKSSRIIAGILQRSLRNSGTTQSSLFRHLALMAIMFLAIPVWAAVGGRIVGTIADPTGAVVPGAQITVINQATGIMQHAVSDSKGLFSFE